MRSALLYLQRFALSAAIVTAIAGGNLLRFATKQIGSTKYEAEAWVLVIVAMTMIVYSSLVWVSWKRPSARVYRALLYMSGTVLLLMSLSVLVEVSQSSLSGRQLGSEGIGELLTGLSVVLSVPSAFLWMLLRQRS
jgi:hypothetical protein